MPRAIFVDMEPSVVGEWSNYNAIWRYSSLAVVNL